MPKVRERQWAEFDTIRRAVGMLNPLHDEDEGMYRGGERMTPATTDQEVAEGKCLPRVEL